MSAAAIAGRRPPARHAQQGALLIEVLVAILLSAVALLGYVALQARASTAEFEALQRSQALVLVNDMASRLSANRAQAGTYVTAGLIGEGTTVNCSSLTSAARDVCEWANLLRGASEIRGGTRVGAMPQARGCVTRASGSSDRYIVTVAWLGLASSGAPSSPCGAGNTAFPDDSLRRAVSTTVCVARLRDPLVAVATPRC